MEMDLHPGMFVRVNLLAGRADDNGGLRPLDEGFGRNARGPELLRLVNGGEMTREKLASAGIATGGREFTRVHIH